jgi:hypothetical protein
MPRRSPAAVSAKTFAYQQGGRLLAPSPGGYLGATEEGRPRRVSFRTTGAGVVHDLRLGGTRLAARVEVRDGTIEVDRPEMSLVAAWLEGSFVRGEVQERRRWGRIQRYTFTAERRFAAT